MRIPVAASLLLAIAAPGTAAATQDNGAWNRAIERMDHEATGDNRGDYKFFRRGNWKNPKTNVNLIYAAKSSMKDFPLRLHRIRSALGGTQPTGCTNAFLNNLEYVMPPDELANAGLTSLAGHYQSNVYYPNPEAVDVFTGGGYGTADNIRTDTSGYYRYLRWPTGGDYDGYPETLNNACTNAGGSSQKNACKQCVQSKGYWLNPQASNADVTPAAGVFAGNWLRFYPPKWQLLRLAYRRLVNGPYLSILREAVVAPDGIADGQATGSDGTVGGETVQKMLPQSCNGNGRPMNQKQKAVDRIDYASSANPLAEMLLESVWYLGGQEKTWYFNLNNQSTHPMEDGKSGPCWTCLVAGFGDFQVLFSDGRGDSANPACTRTGGVLPEWCQAEQACSTQGMGGENDGNDFFNSPSGGSGTATAINGPAVRKTPGGTCDMDWADDVARWATQHTANYAGAGTPITTFVVAVGDPEDPYGEQTMLKEIARAGGGSFHVARDFAGLKASIDRVFEVIFHRAVTMSMASLAPLQAAPPVLSNPTAGVFIPRMRRLDGPQWWGDLYRFRLFDEMSQGCSDADLNHVTATNPNGNASCTDAYVQDNGGAFVGEDPDGNFVQLDNTGAWTTNWPLKVVNGSHVTATPVWDAAGALTSRMNLTISGASSDPRSIYTVAPNGTGYGPGLLAVDVAHVATLTPLLALGGTTGATCTRLATLTGHTYATEADCATDVIQFLHGYDVLRQSPYNATTPPPTNPVSRPNILGDIFHSAPVQVLPPAPSYLCGLGIVSQCAAALFSSTATPGGMAAYASHAQANKYRTQTVLVGANDGMLHAFNSANDATDSHGRHVWDGGTGREMWAFIPPDLLPKLFRYLLSPTHEYFVDGTPMVRDVWVDGSGATAVDGRKQADEYHTVAVVAERSGGRSYTALDVTNPATPSYLWTWPPPATTEALDAGESWDDLLPAAPPIGPVAWYDTTGPLTVGGVKARERWVVAVGGGWDPALFRGRSINMIDVWTGAAVYAFARRDSTGTTDPRNNLYPIAAPVALIDSEQDSLFDSLVVGDTGGQVWVVNMAAPGRDTSGDGFADNWYGARTFVEFKNQSMSMRSPFFFAAAVAKLDTGQIRVLLGSGNREGMFDGNGGTCSIDNLWACIRRGCKVHVTVHKHHIGPGHGSGQEGKKVEGEWNIEQGGTGRSVDTLSLDSLGQGNATTDVVDRDFEYEIRCPGSWDSDYAYHHHDNDSDNNNYQCGDPANEDNGNDNNGHGSDHHDGNSNGNDDHGYGNGKGYGNSDGHGSCNGNGNDKYQDGYNHHRRSSRPGSFHGKVYCTWNGSLEDCSYGTGRPDGSTINFGSSSTQETSRYYSFLLWGTGARARFTTYAQAQAYDTAALTDTDLVNASVALSTPEGNGWYLPYLNSQDEKTATGSLLLGGCVFWSTLDPWGSLGGRNDLICPPSEAALLGHGTTHNEDETCGHGDGHHKVDSAGTDGDGHGTKKGDGHGWGNWVGCGPEMTMGAVERHYQANAITGGIGCGQEGSATYTTTLRFVATPAVGIPLAPSPMLAVNAGAGTVSYGGLSVESGSPPLTVSTGIGDLVGTLHWLEVTRKMHSCRHGSTDGGTACQ